MPETLPALPLARYQLHLRAPAPCQLTDDPRGLWHGVFGLHLRQLACVVPGTDCPQCLLLHQCGYSQLFSGPRPPDSELMRRYDRIPVPHVLAIDRDFPRVIAAGETVSLGLILVGAANARWPLAVQALRDAGAGGLGARRDRLLLTGCEQWLPDATDPLPLLDAHTGGFAQALPPRAPVTPPLPVAATGNAPAPVLRMEFLTPWKSGGTRARDFAVGPLLMAIVRRVSLLQYFYTGQRLDADFPALKAASEQVRLSNHTLHWQKADRYAARHRERLDLSGLVGTVDLVIDEALAPLWPWLHLGQWLNVGKNASMGFGAWRLHSINPEPTGVSQ